MLLKVDLKHLLNTAQNFFRNVYMPTTWNLLTVLSEWFPKHLYS